MAELIHSGHVVSGQKQCITLWMPPLGNVRKCTVTQTALYIIWAVQTSKINLISQ